MVDVQARARSRCPAITSTAQRAVTKQRFQRFVSAPSAPRSTLCEIRASYGWDEPVWAQGKEQAARMTLYPREHNPRARGRLERSSDTRKAPRRGAAAAYTADRTLPPGPLRSVLSSGAPCTAALWIALRVSLLALLTDITRLRAASLRPVRSAHQQPARAVSCTRMAQTRPKVVVIAADDVESALIVMSQMRIVNGLIVSYMPGRNKFAGGHQWLSLATAGH
ncbi:hypothetical protein B0H15DRAFT_954926 [Mycena belliarum]|uniref:Uncharacterized protein n=1 Tax=Mycena belliarum TaxID=1033014 RepID=A0AAD6XGN0_9AGAR|nr:hypothetical protein B0H15DRAFT_954926 [Mycena belliae]